MQWAGDRKGRPYGGVTRSAVRRADVGIGPYGGLQGVRWAGDRKGRPYGSVTRDAVIRGVGDAAPYESVTRGAVQILAGGVEPRPYERLQGMLWVDRGVHLHGSFLTGREWYVSDFSGGG